MKPLPAPRAASQSQDLVYVFRLPRPHQLFFIFEILGLFCGKIIVTFPNALYDPAAVTHTVWEDVGMHLPECSVPSKKKKKQNPTCFIINKSDGSRWMA